MGENINYSKFGLYFLNRTKRAQTLKCLKNIKLDFTKSENFFILKDTIIKMKDQGTDWWKIFAKHI